MIFGTIICKWRGHKWGRPWYVFEDKTHERMKECKRCGEVREVKPRKAKV